MPKWMMLIPLLLLEFVQVAFTLSAMRLRAFCSEPNRIGVVGGSHSRLASEGGRITLTCCMPGTTNGHDQELLVWFDPQGKELTNHFTNPHSKSEHTAYSLPDYRSRNHLVTMLVIQQFNMDDAGVYSCRKGDPRSTIEPATVSIDARPRLLADYVPLPPISPENSGAAVVAGRPAFVPLEEGRNGEIACRINPNIPIEQVHLTWYFQGRQLIAPASVMIDSEQRGSSRIPIENIFNENFNEDSSPIELETTGLTREHQLMEASQQYEAAHGRPVSMDPAELGLRIVDHGQASLTLQILVFI
ncbi:hypothetical protein EG68_03566 [Paragonimus skrjabini miyazakii]|uniref:Ig-like domain-containing protein n=1 Tax=Paragonimus skrjabini miyazakii TaxID=59628 RepID=A0A8S9YYP9_9TREM|nr:hypothetical protein EG68_03566 [Paragonimus skrjabini miyazakii]